MSQALTVPTHFANIAELSQGFLDRVEEDTLILYGPVPHEEGSTIDFAVLLADGSAALEGTGVVRASVDGGQDRIPETRYDIVLCELGLGGRSEVVFESLVLAREAVSERPEAVEDGSVQQIGASDSERAADVEPSAVEESFDSLSPATLDALDVEEEAIDTVRPSAEMVSEIVLEPEVSEREGAPLEAAQEQLAQTSVEPDVEAALESLENEWEDTSARFDDEVAASAEREPQSWDDEPSLHDTIEETDEPAEGGVWDSEPVLGVVAELAQLDDGEPSAPAGRPELLPESGIPTFDPSIPPQKPVAAEPPSEPPPPPSFALTTPPEGLTRPSRGDVSDSEPPPVQMQELEPSSGLFQYERGLPIPSRPPLPNLDPTHRVAAAEAPADPDSEPPLELAQSDRLSSDPPFVEEGYEDVRLSELEERFEEG